MIPEWSKLLFFSIIGTILLTRTIFNYLQGEYPKGKGWKAFCDGLVYATGTFYFMINLLIVLGV